METSMLYKNYKLWFGWLFLTFKINYKQSHLFKYFMLQIEEAVLEP